MGKPAVSTNAGVSKPQFSAVIPTFNRGPLVQRAVESALTQTYPPVEIIVVDDGSTDETRNILSAYEGRIIYLYQENSGSAVARNHGIQAASTNWVALLDSDDVWLEGHLEKMGNAIQETSGVAHYYFADTIQPPERGGGSLWQSLSFNIDGAYEYRLDGSAWALMGIQPMMLQSTVFNRAAFLQAGGFLQELRYRDDTHMFLRLGLEQPLCAVAGFGARMSADDDPDNRLTLSFNRTKRGYHMQTIMNEDLLQKMPDINPQSRKLIRARLANAHWSLARVAWQEKDFSEFFSQLRYSMGKGSKRQFANRFVRLANRP